MNSITFSHNWNKNKRAGKLDCKCFTTIRLYEEGRYSVGEKVKVLLDDKKIGVAKIVHLRKIFVTDIPEEIYYCDTGYDKEKSIEILKKMWQHKIREPFVIITLCWCNDEQIDLF